MKPRLLTAGYLAFATIGRLLASDKNVYVRPIEAAEASLRKIAAEPGGPTEIFSLLSEGTWGGVGQRFLLVFNDHAILRCDDDNGRTRERGVNNGELDELRSWLLRNKIDQLPPYDEAVADGVQYQYFHLLRNGTAHRVFMNNPPGAPIGSAAVFFGGIKPVPKRQLYGDLTRRMLKLDQAPMRVIYQNLEHHPDFRVVHAKEKGEIVAVSHEDGKLIAARWSERSNGRVWYAVTESGVADQPIVGGPNRPRPEKDDRDLESFPIKEGSLTGRNLLVSWSRKPEGLWIGGGEKRAELLARGIYGRDPVICPGGEWVVVSKTQDGNMWQVPNGVVRIHLPTRRVLPVDLRAADNFDPLVWVDAHSKVLLCQWRDPERGTAGPAKPEFYLLDAITGEHRKVEGEFRPFFDASRHPLQATGQPNEFWATLHSTVVDPNLRTVTLGRFDSYQFRFAPLITFPDMHFDSASVFVDSSAGFIWLNVNGDVLRCALSERSP